ncbi:MAG: hypothetical protein AAF563_22345 [Pseudomonadota bacterium]
MTEKVPVSRSVSATVFVLPGLLVFAYDLLFLGRGYPLVSYDSITGMYGLGLNWVALEPWPTPHHPAFFIQQLGGLAALISGVMASSLQAFANVTVAIQFGFLMLAALWFAREVERLRLPLAAVVAVALITATMPTVMIMATHWGHYYPIGILLAPCGLALAGVFARTENRPADWWLAFGGLGFITANFYICGAIALPACLFVLWRYVNSGSEERFAWLGLAGAGQTRGWPLWMLIAAIMLTFALCLPPMLYVVAGPGSVYQIDWTFMGPVIGISAVLSIPVGAVAWFVLSRLRSWLPLFTQAVSPLLWGWLIGVNIMAGFWFIGAIGTFLTKSGLAATDSATPDPLPFLLSHLWNWWIVACIGLALIAIMVIGRRDRAAAIGLFALFAIVINVLIGWSFITDTSLSQLRPDEFGLTPRYVMTLLAVGPILIALIYRCGPRWLAGVTIAVSIVLSIGSAVQFVNATTEATAQAAEVDDQLGAIIDQYLAANPSGQVLCLNTEGPEVCATLYAYHRYRKPESYDRLPPVSLESGRIQYRPRWSDNCWISDADDCWGLDETADGRVLVIDGSGMAADGASPGSQVLWQGERFGQTYAAIELDMNAVAGDAAPSETEP